MATITSTTSGNWSSGGTWVGGVAPIDNDTVVMETGHSIMMDVDMSAYTNGINGLTIKGGVTPAMLYFKYDADGTYCLKMKTGSTISGTLSTNKGRLLANSDGTWGTTTAASFGRKQQIILAGTAQISAANLDIAMYSQAPTISSVRIYGTKYTVSSVNTSTDTLTLASSPGWSANTVVCVKSTGTVPGGLEEDTPYYVTSPSGANLKLALVSSGVAVDITSAGSGTIEIYSGHTNTLTATVNVLDDVTGDATWTTASGHNYVILSDNLQTGSTDHQALTLSSISSGTITLSANVDSVQLPNARIYLSSRNVSIQTGVTATSVAINAPVNGVFNCEIRTTSGSIGGYAFSGGSGNTVGGTVTRFTHGVSAGTSYTISGSVLGCSYITNAGTGHTVSGINAANDSGISSANTTMSGTIYGSTQAVYNTAGVNVTGSLIGGSTAIHSCANCTMSGVTKSFTIGVGNSSFNTMASGSFYGITTAFTNAIDVIFSGSVYGCTNFSTGNCSIIFRGGTIASTVGTGINMGSSNTAVKAFGIGASISAVTPVSNYKFSSQAAVESRLATHILDYGGTKDYLLVYTQGGKTATVAYSSGTHGSPPVSSSYIHESTFEDNNRNNWVEYQLLGVANQQITVTFYGKLTGTSTWTTRPSIGLYDPSKAFMSVAEQVSVSSAMASNTNWQTITLTYTPSVNMALTLRMQGIGGTSSGSGTEKLYWFHTVSSGSSAIASISPLFGSIG